jgi:hypothetical protein
MTAGGMRPAGHQLVIPDLEGGQIQKNDFKQL